MFQVRLWGSHTDPSEPTTTRPMNTSTRGRECATPCRRATAKRSTIAWANSATSVPTAAPSMPQIGSSPTVATTFTATAAAGPRFVRVSGSDRRYFEYDNGACFFPIGHNVRSAYDSRMDDKFPWKLRHPEGTLAYERFFREMEAAQENLVEIWSCAWSLGLEWTSAPQVSIIMRRYGFWW